VTFVAQEDVESMPPLPILFLGRLPGQPWGVDENDGLAV